MPRRTQIFRLAPWTGGVNTSVDPGVLPANDLVQADNVVFSTSGTRLKREGISYFDSSLPAVVSRSSSGTTRTLVFASSINTTVPVDEKIVVGEQLAISGGPATYRSDEAIVSALSTTNVANDTISYSFSGATSVTESTTADSSFTVARSYAIIGNLDFWYFDPVDNAKEQTQVALTSQGLLFRYDDGGRRKQIAKSGSGATTITGPLTSCDLRAYNNKLIVTMSGVGNTPKYFDPNVADEWKDLPGAPDGSIMQEHLGRLWMNDKTDPDRLHFSETYEEAIWLGNGDSGALFIAAGDGDTMGISALFPPFKGVFMVAKGDSVHKVLGDAPENFAIDDMTKGFGAISHKAVVPVDLDDIYFMSRRGLHSVITTDAKGDFAANYLSAKIQPTFNSWSRGRLQFTQGVYLPALNSVAWCVAEDGETDGSALWIFNPTVGEGGEWYRWPNINAQSLSVRLDDDKKRLVVGTSDGRLLIAQNATYTDYGSAGIPFRIATGVLYMDGDPQTNKAFKKLSLLFKPRGRFNFTCYFQVDNFPRQALAFAQSVRGDTLGSDFVLGQSTLGSDTNVAPITQDIYGHGRGCSIEIFQTGAEAQVEIYGLMIEWESADIADEVNQEG